MPSGGRIRVGAHNVTIPLIERRALPRLEQHQRVDRRGPRLALPGGDYVAIPVSDTGTGMDEATLARAIEPFFTTKPLGKGTGLGLAMVHDLITQAGGALRLISHLGQGTTAELWFPRASAPIARDRQATSRASSPDAVEVYPVLSGNPGQVCNPNDE
jgi:signal transduction histidine kinase